MLYAMTDNGRKIQATPGATARCPECDQPVLAKCGVINIWHWAHVSTTNCDLWGEPESAWHLEWKSHWPASQVEVVMTDGKIRHRADVVTLAGVVIELQHSAISPADIQARERFYKRMIWVFDAKEPFDTNRLELRNKGSHYTFRWKQPRKHLAICTQPIALDIGDGDLFWIKKIHTEAPCGGWGVTSPIASFITAHGGS
jgi:competence protein CoiA